MFDAGTCSVLEFDKVKNIVAGFALSPLGSALAQSLAPMCDSEYIELLLEQVSEVKILLQFDDPFPLAAFEDINPILKTCSIEGTVLDPSEILAVHRVLETVRLVKEYVSERRRKYLLLSELCEPIQAFPDFEKRVVRVFDERGEVSDNASGELHRIRRELKRGHENLRATLDKTLQALTEKGLVQEPVITIREGRFVLPVKAENRGRVKGVVHDQSSSGATLFIEPLAAIDLNNHLRELQLAERQEIRQILRELTQWLRMNVEHIRRNVAILSELDFIQAKARMSIEYGGVKPKLNRENRSRIVGGRHPLLMSREHSDHGRVVPLDLSLGETFRTLIITGPNAGGKTVALKTIGLLTLMVQAGMHVPASEKTELAVYDKVFADIGDQQSIEYDLSSFSAHLQQLKRIIDEADDRTLVLIDELGAGTDPDEGSALGMATLEVLTERGGCTLVTTHHGALKAFAQQHPEMENGSMEFDQKTLQPTYRFHSGIPGSSYAFQIADRLGMDSKVISVAASFVGEKGRRVEDLIVQLNRSFQEYEQRRRFVEEDENRLKRLLAEYEEKVASIKQEAKEIRREAYAQADEILAKANALLESTVAEIREQQAAKKAIKKAKREITGLRDRVGRGLEANRTDEEGVPENVVVGQEVWIPGFHTTGTVLSGPDVNRRVLIQAGRAKVEMPLSQLRLPEGTEGLRRYSRGGVSYDTQRDISTEVSVRGMTGDEACDAIEKYLDDAFVTGLSTVRIIHGKGTGILRERINQYLESHPKVQSKRFGNWDEGGIGVTIVELK
jgi:DNA mismatch repair protein MutS2